MTTATTLTAADLKIAKEFRISPDKFAEQVAKHERENPADEGRSGTKLSEDFDDLSHAIDLGLRVLSNGGNPRTTLECALLLAARLRGRILKGNHDQSGDSAGDHAQGGLPMLNRVASHARMPGASKIR